MRVEAIIEKAGGAKAISEELGITTQAVYKWARDGFIPLKKVRAVAAMAGLKPETVAKREIP